MTAPTPDAVAQAREDMVQSVFVDDSLGLLVIPANKIDALIAAVRAECAAKVRVLRDASESLPAYTDTTHAQKQGELSAFDAVLRSLEAQP